MAKKKETEELTGEEYKVDCYLKGILAMDKFIDNHERMAAYAARRSFDHERVGQWQVCRSALLELLPKKVREEYEASLVEDDELEVEV